MKYSIIIPHYNRPDLIMNTINSFKELKDKEIIIVDDVSTIDNLNKLKDNVRKLNDLSISIITPPTKCYLPGARNRGIELAKGEWIFFIDDDDEATPNFIKWLNSGKQKKKYDFYRFPYQIQKQNRKDKVFRWFGKNFLYSFQVSSFLIQREYILKNKIQFNETQIKFCEDVLFSQKIHSVKNNKFKYINLLSIFFNDNQNISSIRRNIEEDLLYYVKASSLANEFWHNTYVLIMLYFAINAINNNKVNNIEKSKKQIIDIYQKLKIRQKDILRLDFFRLIHWPSMKKRIKRWMKNK